MTPTIPASASVQSAQDKLSLIYRRLQAGSFYDDYDRATEMVGWLREIVEQPAASQEAPAYWGLRNALGVCEWHPPSRFPVQPTMLADYDKAFPERAPHEPYALYTHPQQPSATGGDGETVQFNTGDDDLDLLLGLAVDIEQGRANMDTGIWWLQVLDRVKERLTAPASQPTSGAAGDGQEVGKIDEQAEFERAYNRTFRGRAEGTKHINDCELMWQARAALATPPAQQGALTEPIGLFAHGPWIYGETGEQFTGAELDEVAFVAYASGRLRATTPQPSQQARQPMTDGGEV